MDDEALFRANLGWWVLGGRAEKEQYALFSAEGRSLKAGDEVRDAYVGAEPSIAPHRDPIAYFESPHGVRLCQCGCGETVTTGWFLIGHDQKAHHARVAKVGTVRPSRNRRAAQPCVK